MKRHKKIAKIMLVIIITISFIALSACSPAQNNSFNSTVQDSINTRISFNKKYYFLSYNDFTKKEYYTFFNDHTATYTHIIEEQNTITFHQIINFKWTYTGEGKCILIHNGTQVLKGSQDDACGFCRVMYISKDLVFWSTAGENTYFICEDFPNQIPGYSKLLPRKQL